MRDIPPFDEWILERAGFPVEQFLDQLALLYKHYGEETRSDFAGTPYEKDAEFADRQEFMLRWCRYTRINSDDPNPRSEVLGFIVDAARAGRCSLGGVSSAKGPHANYPHGCYYNALDYVINRPGSKLLWGYVIPATVFSRLATYSSGPRPMGPRGPMHRASFVNMDITEHAFVMDEGKLVDPTLGSDRGESWYFWEEVPESVWRRFSHKPNDSGYDARDFGDGYIDTAVLKHKFPWKTLMARARG